MKRALMIALALLVATAATGYAQTPPKAAGTGPAFVDANGDGICDNYQAGNRLGNGGQGKGKRGGYGPGDGTGNQGVGPRDGTGFGAGNGTGICDGTGPKGAGKQMRRGGKR